jgi:DNA-binding NarL/FixJ family response regulator
VPEGPTRIILADDHPLVLEAVRALLDGQPGLKVMAAATDGRQLLDLTGRLKPDLVILDLQLPGVNGLDCLRRIKQFDPAIQVIVLSAFGDAETVRAVVQAGAEGFVLKTDPPGQVINAIRQVLSGQLVFPRSARRWLQPEQARPDLSDLDRRLLGLLAEGRSNEQIARTLNVSPNTVKYYLKNLFRKLGVGNRTEAVSWYLRQPRPFTRDQTP